MKAWFFIALGFYVLFAIIGARDAAYLDVETERNVFHGRLVLLILIALVTGLVFFFWFLRIFPKGWAQQKRIGKIFLPLIFPFLAFILGKQVMIFVNNYIGSQKAVSITGRVAGKYTEKRRRGYDYFLLVMDTVRVKEHMLKVSAEAYEATLNGHFNKQFKIGSLGIIYRRNI
jgi:hypothetical protein